jgi:Holliday junction resolvase-like predicted endonuclease
VAVFLKQCGYKVIERNWKTKVCEIDLVAQKDGTIYFIEVKYRSSPAQGSGYDYITYHKLNRMDFAARIWVQQHGWDGDYRLMAAAVAGADCQAIDISEI